MDFVHLSKLVFSSVRAKFKNKEQGLGKVFYFELVVAWDLPEPMHFDASHWTTVKPADVGSQILMSNGAAKKIKSIGSYCVKGV